MYTCVLQKGPINDFISWILLHLFSKTTIYSVILKQLSKKTPCSQVYFRKYSFHEEMTSCHLFFSTPFESQFSTCISCFILINYICFLILYCWGTVLVSLLLEKTRALQLLFLPESLSTHLNDEIFIEFKKDDYLFSARIIFPISTGKVGRLSFLLW